MINGTAEDEKEAFKLMVDTVKTMLTLASVMISGLIALIGLVSRAGGAAGINAINFCSVSALILSVITIGSMLWTLWVSIASAHRGQFNVWLDCHRYPFMVSLVLFLVSVILTAIYIATIDLSPLSNGC